MSENPRRKRTKGVPMEELERVYPSLTTLASPVQAAKGSWVAAFSERPDAMQALLADFIKQVHAKPGRIGQRPMPREEEVDFHNLVFMEDNELPIHEILPRVMKISGRKMATRVHMTQTQFSRLLAGKYIPDVNEIRLIAAEVGKPPAYFAEYRKAMVMVAMMNLLDERPGIATRLYREYLEVRMREIG